MNTRKDYLDGKCTHDQYYYEIVKQAGIVPPKHLIDKSKVSTDEHLNDVPLKLWDEAAPIVYSNFRATTAMKERGDYMTLSGAVSLLKTATKHIISK